MMEGTEEPVVVFPLKNKNSISTAKLDQKQKQREPQVLYEKMLLLFDVYQ